MKTILKFLLIALSVASAHGRIKVKQTLQIIITGVPSTEQTRLNSSYPVSTDGFIDMWKVGKIKAVGLTSSELAASITAKFKAAQIYSNPVFNVLNTDEANEAARAKEAAEREAARDKEVVKDTGRFTVGGAVNRTGPQQWTEGANLYSAIQAAGGPNPFGAINRVKLFRNGQVYEYNLRNDAHKSVKIYPKDLIDVPEKGPFGR